MRACLTSRVFWSLAALVLVLGAALTVPAQQAAAPIQIAWAGPLTGDAAQFGQGYLKGIQLTFEEWNAKGGVLGGRKFVVVTEDDACDPKQAATVATSVLAIQAGHDALLKPQNAIAMIEAVGAAVESGEIPIARIDASVDRILYWKARLGLPKNRFVDTERIASVVGTKAHLDLVREVAERSLTILTNRDVSPTNAKVLGKIAYVSLQKNEHDPAPVTAAAK